MLMYINYLESSTVDEKVTADNEQSEFFGNP